MTQSRFKIRGTGLRHTIRFVGRFSGLWLSVTVTAVVVAGAACYVILADHFVQTSGAFVAVLVVQTLFVIAAVVGLALFSTHRLAGPWIAVKRALDDVAQGDFDRELTIRRADDYLKEVEASFNRMMERIRDEIGSPGES